MTTQIYVLDTNIISRLSKDELSAPFLFEYCRIPSEVIYETRLHPNIEHLKTIQHPTTIESLHAVAEIMSTLDPKDRRLVDLFDNKGGADPFLIAAAIVEQRNSESQLFPAEQWTVVTNDRAVAETAAKFNVPTISRDQFRNVINLHTSDQIGDMAS